MVYKFCKNHGYNPSKGPPPDCFRVFWDNQDEDQTGVRFWTDAKKSAQNFYLYYLADIDGFMRFCAGDLVDSKFPDGIEFKLDEWKKATGLSMTGQSLPLKGTDKLSMLVTKWNSSEQNYVKEQYNNANVAPTLPC